MKFESRQGRLFNIKLEYHQCKSYSAGDFFLHFFSPQTHTAWVPYQVLCELIQDALTKFHETSEYRHEKKMAYRNRHILFTSLKDHLFLYDLQAESNANTGSMIERTINAPLP